MVQGIKNDCKIGKVPSITLSIMWIHVIIYRGGILGMTMTWIKLYKPKLFLSFGAQMALAPKLSFTQVLEQLSKYSLYKLKDLIVSCYGWKPG